VSDYSAPSRLTAEHDTANFRCGSSPLDEWLRKYAFTNQRAGMATTYVTTAGDLGHVVGYYALATGGVARPEVAPRVAKGIPNHPVPVLVLARLAVDESYQGRGLGFGLLRDALIRVAAAAEEIGVRALLVHAKDEDARAFYMATAEFEPSPLDPLQLFLLLKDLRKAIDS
jgi:GNAT superfamily N-acetyltransferase